MSDNAFQHRDKRIMILNTNVQPLGLKQPGDKGARIACTSQHPCWADSSPESLPPVQPAGLPSAPPPAASGPWLACKDPHSGSRHTPNNHKHNNGCDIRCPGRDLKPEVAKLKHDLASCSSACALTRKSMTQCRVAPTGADLLFMHTTRWALCNVIYRFLAQCRVAPSGAACSHECLPALSCLCSSPHGSNT